MLSIITINYNNSAGLTRTIESIVKQTQKTNFEHIIIDGSSNDGSVELLKSYSKEHNNTVCLSEPDDGIYNAMNKGLSKANGKMVAFLNSGDVLASNTILEQLIIFLKNYDQSDIVYGDIRIVNADGVSIRNWRSGKYSRYKLLTGWMPPHPMTMINLEMIRKIGGFNEKYRIAADYDLLFRAINNKTARIEYYPNLLVKMEQGGVSNGSLQNILKSNLEVLEIWRQNWNFVPYWIFIAKPLRKLLQYFHG